MNQNYCQTIQSNPISGTGTILVTGANGFIGRKLIPELLARGYEVRVLVRQYSVEYERIWPGAEIVVGNALIRESLNAALENVDTAYYLIHSLTLGNRDFKSTDIHVANQFQEIASEKKVNRIIYLGSLGDEETDLSPHLRNRIRIAKVLRRGSVPVTYLRAAVIVGSESASYQIIKYLVLRFPAFVIPSKAISNCQPISVGDVIRYLVGTLENPETARGTYDIGGDQIYSYDSMLKIQAEVTGKKRLFFISSFIPISFCGYVASLFTPVPRQITKMLIESCRNDAICKNGMIRELIPFQTLSYQEALLDANKESDSPMMQTSSAEYLAKYPNKSGTLVPPSRSRNIFSDIISFCLHKPKIPTLIKFNSKEERENYSLRIMQRMGIDVTKYGILNIHKVGVDAPAKYVFEELLKWDGDSTCWPNFLAKVNRRDSGLNQLTFYLFGWKKFPLGLNRFFKVKPLFHMKAIKLLGAPDELGSDNARFLLYKCSGGYPIGVFSMYVRSSIAEEDEKEEAQLFLMVGFNFYGKKEWSQKKIINRFWELIHNQVTANILNRIKQLSEWRFQKIQMPSQEGKHPKSLNF